MRSSVVQVPNQYSSYDVRGSQAVTRRSVAGNSPNRSSVVYQPRGSFSPTKQSGYYETQQPRYSSPTRSSGVYQTQQVARSSFSPSRSSGVYQTQQTRASQYSPTRSSVVQLPQQSSARKSTIGQTSQVKPVRQEITQQYCDPVYTHKTVVVPPTLSVYDPNPENLDWIKRQEDAYHQNEQQRKSFQNVYEDQLIKPQGEQIQVLQQQIHELECENGILKQEIQQTQSNTQNFHHKQNFNSDSGTIENQNKFLISRNSYLERQVAAQEEEILKMRGITTSQKTQEKDSKNFIECLFD